MNWDPPNRDRMAPMMNRPHGRWVCSLLLLMGIHSPECERCRDYDRYWAEMKKRLEELRWQTPNNDAGSR
jgi:hypothetical protein